MQKAAMWYQRAAEQGNMKGQYEWGDCYYNGWGVDKNEEEAVRWYRKAAEQGYAQAQCTLGDCCLKGKA